MFGKYFFRTFVKKYHMYEIIFFFGLITQVTALITMLLTWSKKHLDNEKLYKTVVALCLLSSLFDLLVFNWFGLGIWLFNVLVWFFLWRSKFKTE